MRDNSDKTNKQCINCGKPGELEVQEFAVCMECIRKAIEDSAVMPKLIRPLIAPVLAPILKDKIRTHPEVHAIHPSTFTGLFPPTTGGLM